MIRPTPRAVIVFAAGIPISLVLALAAERLWPLGLAYLACAILLTGLDALLAPRSRLLTADIRAPELLYACDRDDLRPGSAGTVRHASAPLPPLARRQHHQRRGAVRRVHVVSPSAHGGGSTAVAVTQSKYAPWPARRPQPSSPQARSSSGSR